MDIEQFFPPATGGMAKAAALAFLRLHRNV